MTLTRAHLWVLAAYLVAIAGAGASLALVADLHPMWRVLAADVAATAIIFAFSLGTGNSSMYDPYWSVAPPVICLYLIALEGNADSVRQALVLLVVVVWSVRLTGNWLYGWQGMAHEDWRYVDLRAKAGVWWWALSFSGIHLFPTLIVFLGCLALYPALTLGSAAPGWIDLIAVTLGFGAAVLEFVADRQLHRHRAARSSNAEVMDHGVWARCRHPNYLGEIAFWVSLFLFAVAATDDVTWLWLAASGPAAMLLLFSVVSIPMLEARLAANKPGYAAYRHRTWSLLPRPGKKVIE